MKTVSIREVRISDAERLLRCMVWLKKKMMTLMSGTKGGNIYDE